MSPSMVDVENKEQYVTIGQVAESAGVTIETVRRWDREGCTLQGQAEISGAQSSGLALLSVYRCAATIERPFVLRIKKPSGHNNGPQHPRIERGPRTVSGTATRRPENGDGTLHDTAISAERYRMNRKPV